ncbi:alpha/beta fold hydrolase [Halorhabdus amylolytica]|uniref:alpha/beta fold hydrolase n=1 Tax=Halorhabdus amylolytica TaxID=2559573 RepID=UPI0010AAB9D6|nr:alpha/beta fold hydrolase [Halorhabdus amylolytica]
MSADGPKTIECRLPDDRTLAYTVAGEATGPTVVANHGIPGSRLFARLLADAARSAGVRLLVPDRPGYGRSDAPPEDRGLLDWRRDYEALLAHESVETATVLGFSGGGPFALAAATSDRTGRIALVSATIPGSGGALTMLARVPFLLRGFFRLGDWRARQSGPEVLVNQLTGRDLSPETVEAVAADYHEALRQNAHAPVRELRSSATTQTFDLPDTALRVWHGTADENAPLAPVRTLATEVGGECTSVDADHLGTLLECRRDAIAWLSQES